MDFAFLVKHRLPARRLQHPKPPFLADGILSSWITHTTELRLRIGDHEEPLLFYITNLAKENPVILGLPWLRLHNPTVDWGTLRLTFRRGCHGRCLSHHVEEQEAPHADVATPSPFRTTVEEVEGEGEPGWTGAHQHHEAEMSNRLSEAARQRQSRHKREWRLRQRLKGQREKALTNGPRWTFAPPGARGVMIPNALPKRPALARLAAGARSPEPRRPTTTRTPPPSRRGKMKPTDIRLLSAANFLFLARQKGVAVLRTTLAELEEAVRDAPSINLPELPEEFFKDLLRRRGRPEDYTSRLPHEFHDFVDALWTDDAILNKITEEDAEKFFRKSDKPALTPEDIKKRLPSEYRDLFAAFLPQEADTLPPHRSYDHKIELLPGQKVPVARNRPLSPMELRVLKRWLDDNLAKGFIRPSKSSAASPILLAQKPGGGVRICVDYRGINNVTLKSRYPIPLIRETLDSICKATIFTKLDVIAAINRVRIAEGHEWLTAFITRFGLYESLVTPFGLQGAPATFQHYINDVLYDILDDYATAYLSAIMISMTRSYSL
jgi:hypothetical protein